MTAIRHFAHLGKALRLLRERAGLSQAALQEKAKLGASTVSDWERGVSTPHLDSVNAILNALKLDLFDLARAIDEVSGRSVKPSSGKPRPRWVSVLAARQKFDGDSLWSFAASMVDPDDPNSKEDFVASVLEVVNAIAREAIEQAGKLSQPTTSLEQMESSSIHEDETEYRLPPASPAPKKPGGHR